VSEAAKPGPLGDESVPSLSRHPEDELRFGGSPGNQRQRLKEARFCYLLNPSWHGTSCRMVGVSPWPGISIA
jgi:hypothetical protein